MSRGLNPSLYGVQAEVRFLNSARRRVRPLAQKLSANFLSLKLSRSFVLLFLAGLSLSLAIAACAPQSTNAPPSAQKPDVELNLVSFSVTQAAYEHIIPGQYLGFSLLILASLPGFLGGLIIPQTWIGLLGFLPLAIGTSQLIKQDEEQTPIRAASRQFKKRLPMSTLANLLTPQTSSVAAITVANGGDNIGIYVPLFANSKLPEFAVILGIFFILIGIWCYVAYQLTRQPPIGRILTRHGKRLVPFVLIGLGIFILIDSKTYQLLPFLKGG